MYGRVPTIVMLVTKLCWWLYGGDNSKMLATSLMNHHLEIDISNEHNKCVTNINCLQHASPISITVWPQNFYWQFFQGIIFPGCGNKSWYFRLQLTSRLSLSKYFICHQYINKLNESNSEDFNINAVYDLGCRKTITGLMT